MVASAVNTMTTAAAFVLQSGPYRKRKQPADGDADGLSRDIAEAMAPLVPDDIDALAGLELGGVPLAVVLSQVTGLPTRFVRKEAKTYGTARFAEGGAVDRLRLVIVEDVITTGGQVRASAGDLRELGAIVDQVVCVIDREAGGAQKLAEDDLKLSALFTASEL